MSLDPAEERVIGTVKCLLDRGRDDRRWLEGEAVVWVDDEDPDQLRTTVCTRVEDWEVRVISAGLAFAAWQGEGLAPGAAAWAELTESEKLLRLIQGQGSPHEMPLLVSLEMTEMGPEWEVCLAMINLGHLRVPYVPAPAMESL